MSSRSIPVFVLLLIVFVPSRVSTKMDKINNMKQIRENKMKMLMQQKKSGMLEPIDVLIFFV